MPPKSKKYQSTKVPDKKGPSSSFSARPELFESSEDEDHAPTTVTKDPVPVPPPDPVPVRYALPAAEELVVREADEDGWSLVSGPPQRREESLQEIPEFSRRLSSEIEGTPLPHVYILYYHPPDEQEWTVDSFKSVRFRTVEDMISFWAAMNKSMFNSYYVFMRAGFTPVWEDEKLHKGGSWSFKVTSTQVDAVMFNLAIRLVCGMLGDPKKIVGISSNAQRTNGIIKIWSTDFRYVTGDVGAEMLETVFENSITGFPTDAAEVQTFCHVDQKHRTIEGDIIAPAGTVRLQGGGPRGWHSAAGGPAGGGGRRRGYG